MGSYTQFVFHAYLHKDTPQDIIEFLQEQLYSDSYNKPIVSYRLLANSASNHEFFTCPHWKDIFDTIYEFSTPAGSNGFYIVINTKLKDYNDEIDKFIQWIMPYLKKNSSILGFYMHEDDEVPTYIYGPRKEFDSNE